MSNTWFDDEVEGEACSPKEAQLLKDYLQDRIDTNEASHLITSRIANNDKPYELLTSYWGLLQDALMDIPPERSKVVKLLQVIQQSPTADISTKDDYSLASLGPEIRWSELPNFGHMWADSTKWQDWRRTSGPQTAEQNMAEDQAITARLQGQAWRNARYQEIATIEAQLVASGINAIPLNWGYRAICDALEDSNALLEMEVLAAEEWLSIAGKQIRESTPVAGDSERLSALGKHRDLWKGPEGMGKERWEFWKQRLECVQGQDVSKTTKEAAREAIAAMKAIDGQP